MSQNVQTVAVVVVGAGAAATGAAVVSYLYSSNQRRKLYDKARAEWAELAEDVVVLHQPPRPPSYLSVSPFAIKVSV